MAFVFKMPEVGEGVVEAEVTEWKVAVGDRIETDQPMCEITTDKAQIEISSPTSGTISRLLAQPGEVVRVHAPLVEIDDSGDESGAPASVAAPARAAQAATPERPKGPAAAAAAAAAATIAVPTAGDLPRAPASSGHAKAAPASSGHAKAAPAVRRRAQELGLDVAAVAGTGPGGRVTRADVDSAQSAPLPKAPVALPQVTPRAAEDQVVKIVGVRRKIAERMVHAKQTAPHFTYVEEVDCSRLVAFRDALKAHAASQGVRLTYLPFFAKACSIAFRDFPNVNAWMDTENSELVVKGAHHIGFACDTPSGLMVPVVQNVEQKSILRVAAELQDLFERCRAGHASRTELSGSTFTITGVGNIGGVLATPILNLPEVGILGVNEIKKRPVVVDDEIVIRPMTYLSNSFDHRIVDGAVGARFTARVKALIEAPETMLMELV